MNVLVINGPNLNLLGTREPEIYGTRTLASIADECMVVGEELGLAVEFVQSNHEGELVDCIQGAMDTVAAIIINAAAYTHTSIAIHDALKAYPGVIVELHISNPKEREAFRHVSYVEPVADRVIAGRGVQGYVEALQILPGLLANA